jgi:cold shock protein
MGDVLQRAADPSVAPRGIFLGHAHHQSSDLREYASTARCGVAYVHCRAMSCRCQRKIDSNFMRGKGIRVHQGRCGEEYFFHRSAVYGEGLENLKEGDGVEFELDEGPKGPRAENVRRTTT